MIRALSIKPPKNHTTNDEIMYIDNIGKHHVITSKIEPMVMLKNYIEAAFKRSDWGNMDKTAVIAHAQLKYAKMQ